MKVDYPCFERCPNCHILGGLPLKKDLSYSDVQGFSRGPCCLGEVPGDLMVKTLSLLIRDSNVGPIDADRAAEARRPYAHELEYCDLVAEGLRALTQMADHEPPLIRHSCMSRLVGGKMNERAGSRIKNSAGRPWSQSTASYYNDENRENCRYSQRARMKQ
jgi:hypothetical protein